jgi:hypothetical protein
MTRKIVYVFLFSLLLSACGSQVNAAGEGDVSSGRNPKDARVTIENDLVTIKLPRRTSYFWLEKVSDDSVQYQTLYFKYDTREKNFFFQTNLAVWQPVVLEKNAVEMGKVKVVFDEKEIIITYPSGTWAFP